MYNTPVRFDGDIIITDPCYIMNHNNDDNAQYPDLWDYISQKHEVPNLYGGMMFGMPRPEYYPDCREKTILDCRDEHEKVMFGLECQVGKRPLYSETLRAEWDAYHAAQDAYYAVPHDDWARCNCGSNMSVLGFSQYLCDSTIYGDWSCTTFNADTQQPIGQFCADAGMVGVFLLDEVLRYNPDYADHLKCPHAVTLIRDFHGVVELCVEDDEVVVVGMGNVNFVGKQTGF